MDESAAALSSAEEQVKRSTAELGHVTEELRRERDRSGHFEKQRSSLKAQVEDLQLRLEETEAAAVAGSRRTAQTLDQRTADLASQAEAERRRCDEAHRSIRKLDRRVRELLSQLEEERKSKAGLVDHVEGLQQKVKAMKHQVEEAVGDGSHQCKAISQR